VLTKGIPIPKQLREETPAEAKEIREKYEESKMDNWLNRFMKNPHYSIVENEGAGDCLFACVRDAFSQIAQQTSVQKIRKKLSEEATETLFTNYRELYDMYAGQILKETQEIKSLGAKYAEIQNRHMAAIDRNEKKMLADLGKKTKAEHTKLIENKKVTAEILKEYTFMKDIESLPKLKKKITTCEFWGETWALSTLERILNIKFILLSSEAYNSNDINNILQCGQLNDTILENQGYFKPDYYIIVNYLGWHYNLVGYRKKMIFTFKEIPYDINNMPNPKR
jgi:hypothetical protein